MPENLTDINVINGKKYKHFEALNLLNGVLLLISHRITCSSLHVISFRILILERKADEVNISRIIYQVWLYTKALNVL